MAAVKNLFVEFGKYFCYLLSRDLINHSDRWKEDPRKEKKMKKRISILLAFLLLLSGVNFSSFKVSANELPYLLVKFLSSEGGETISTQKVFANGSINGPAIPHREGYIFKGWKPIHGYTHNENALLEFCSNYDEVVADGGALTGIGPEYENVPSDGFGKTLPARLSSLKVWKVSRIIIQHPDDSISADLHFIPVWEGAPNKQVKVSFETHGGLPVPAEQIIKPGDHPVEPATGPSKEGYTFLGWAVGDEFVDFKRTTPTADITYEARYYKNSDDTKPLRVSFDAMGGLPEPPFQEMSLGYRAIKPAVAPVKEGYTFVAWHDSEGEYDFDSGVIRDKVLYARYVKEGDDDTHDRTRRGDINVPDDDYDRAIIPYSQPYITGYPDNTFRADNTITRAEMATVFTKLLDLEDEPSPKTATFSDTQGHWAEDNINKVAEYGLLKGYPDGSFKPEGKMKRAEIASIISKYWEIKGFEPNIEDADIRDIQSHWAEKLITALYNHNFVDLYADRTFKPNAPLDRATVVQILNRITDRPLRQDENQILDDVIGRDWFFKEVGAAAR